MHLSEEIMKIIIVLLILCLPIAANSAVIFEDSFDAQTLWQPIPNGASNDMGSAGAVYTCDYGSDCSSKPPPTGWTNYKTSGLWWPPTYKPTLEITDQVYRGASGKAFRFYNESNNGASGDGWGNDGMLTKLLSTDQQELYVQFWIQFQGSWQYTLTDDTLIKLFRVMHFDKTGSMYTYFSGGNSAPISIYDLKFSNTYGIRAQVDGTFRCDPQATDYMCSGLTVGDILWPGSTGKNPTSSGMLADGNWHRMDFHYKMNTYSGGVWNTDGIYELSVDGTQIVTRTNINWKRNGSNESIGWNVISLGGNNHNLYTAASNHGEQWYAMDDVVISTTPIAADYTIGGVAAVNGVCGASNGQSFVSLTSGSSNLCSSGTVASFAGTGPWTWGCNGSGGGTSTASNACTASIITDTTKPTTGCDKSGRYQTSQVAVLETNETATTQYCVSSGADCTPNITGTSKKMCVNIPYQKLCYRSTDAAGNIEDTKCTEFRKQRRR